MVFTEHKVSGKGVGVIDHYIRKRNAEHTSVQTLCFYLSAIMFLLSMNDLRGEMHFGLAFRAVKQFS